MFKEFVSEISNVRSITRKSKYNDFEYNKKARNKYIGKKPNAYGIDKILYKIVFFLLLLLL